MDGLRGLKYGHGLLSLFLLPSNGLGAMPKNSNTSEKKNINISRPLSQKVMNGLRFKSIADKKNTLPQNHEFKNPAPMTTQTKQKIRENTAPSRNKYEIVKNLGFPEVINANKKIDLVPNGYIIKNVPGDGLCGYWSVLLAKKIAEQLNNNEIFVKKSEVFVLLEKLAARIAHVNAKENRTEEENWAIEEIQSLINNDKFETMEHFLNQLKTGHVQLDSPLSVFLAPVIGFDIHKKYEKYHKGNRFIIEDIYKSGGTEDNFIQIYYQGNGGSGHYQAIIPKGKDVNFN